MNQNLKTIITLILVLLLTLNQQTSLGVPMNKNIKFISEINNIKEYKLSNGIKILLKTDNSSPLVTFSVWYKVGSRNEVNGIRGIAHFLEHMMFKGTKKFQKGEIASTIQGRGGVFNAFTFCDATAYYETISSEYLEKMMEIESDRFKNSLLDEKELQSEKTVVLSELKGGLNNPSNILDNAIREISFIRSPYKHPVIGYEEDINSVNSKTMRKFYEKYYTPENATIVLIGDFKIDNALFLIDKYFGKIKKENYTEKEIPSENLHNQEKRISIKKSGSTKLVQIVYHIPSIKDKDIYALNVLEEILIVGKKSKLNKALFEKGLVSEVSGGAEGYIDPGLFNIIASLTPKAKYKNVEKIILSEIDKLAKKPPTEDEIIGAKNRIKASYLFNLDGSYNQVLKVGYFNIVSNWKDSIYWTDNIDQVTKDDVLNVLKKYFTKGNRSIGYFIPDLKKGQKLEPQPIQTGATQHLTTNSKKPPAKPEISTKNNYTKKIKSPKYTKHTLKDGSTLFVYKEVDLPITFISGFFKGGASLLQKKDEITTTLMERTIEKGSKRFSKNNIETILDQTGLEIDYNCDDESFRFYATTLNENATQAADLLTELLMNPTFPLAEIKKEKKRMETEMLESKEDPSLVGRITLSQILYDKNHPYYQSSIDEDINSLKEITIKNLFNAHNKTIKNNKATIIIGTSLKDKELDNVIKVIENNLMTNKKKTISEINIPSSGENKKTIIKNVLMKDKYQSEVYLAHTTKIRRKHPDFYRLIVANNIIGGDALTSRLAKKIRDDNGLAYKVLSYISPTYGEAEFVVNFGTTSDKVDKAIDLAKLELNKVVKDGVTQKELDYAKKSIIDSFAPKYLSTKSKIVNTILNINFYILGDDYIENYPNIINKITLKEVNDAIKKHIHPENLNISIAGEYSKK